MFNQHPVFICISYAGALSYSILLLGGKRTLRQSFLFTLPSLLIVALLNPLFNHYGGHDVILRRKAVETGSLLEALVYGVVLGAVMFVVIHVVFLL